jgi:hypothetical protein
MVGVHRVRGAGSVLHPDHGEFLSGGICKIVREEWYARRALAAAVLFIVPPFAAASTGDDVVL